MRRGMVPPLRKRLRQACLPDRLRTSPARVPGDRESLPCQRLLSLTCGEGGVDRGVVQLGEPVDQCRVGAGVARDAGAQFRRVLRDLGDELLICGLQRHLSRVPVWIGGLGLLLRRVLRRRVLVLCRLLLRGRCRIRICGILVRAVRICGILVCSGGSSGGVGGDVSSCHTYYNYDNNINYQANLNLQAYVIDYDGVDSFFYFLLNLGQLRNRTALPNDIGYCMNHGLSTYNVHANYRLDDENPVRIEVLYNYTKLLSRIDLSYNPLN